MSLWIRPANIFPRCFADECWNDLRQMGRKAHQVERMLLDSFDSLYRTVPSDVLVKSINEIVNNESKFTVSIDVSKFKLEHLKVNIVGRCLTTEGKEELEVKDGYSMRAFTRQFVLPKDVNLDAIRSCLSDNGQLSVEAPKLTKSLESGGRTIPIEQVAEKP